MTLKNCIRRVKDVKVSSDFKTWLWLFGMSAIVCVIVNGVIFHTAVIGGLSYFLAISSLELIVFSLLFIPVSKNGSRLIEP